MSYGIKYRFRKSSHGDGGYAFVTMSNGWNTGRSESITWGEPNLSEFQSVDAATEFMAEWDGHPWFHSRRLDGKFEVLEIVKKPTVEELEAKIKEAIRGMDSDLAHLAKWPDSEWLASNVENMIEEYKEVLERKT